MLANVVDQLGSIDMADSDTKGDLYEHMLGRIATSGQNGQFRTPRRIIKLMVDMTAPPRAVRRGFLVANGASQRHQRQPQREQHLHEAH